MTSPVSPELSAKIASWRLKAAEGTLTEDEMREAILHLRQGRVSAAVAARTSKTKTRVAAPAAADLLNELDGL